MHIIKLAVLAGAAPLALAPSLPASAKQPASAQRDIVVTKHAPSVAQWSTRVSQDLDRRLASPRTIAWGREPQGLVRLNFECSEDGAPAKVEVVESSGWRRIDAAALKAVEGIPSLHPLPDGVGRDQRYAAVVVFAASEASRDRMVRRHTDKMAAWASLPRVKGRALAMVGPIPAYAR